jgi:hypothetical protein
MTELKFLTREESNHMGGFSPNYQYFSGDRYPHGGAIGLGVGEFIQDRMDGGEFL